MADRTPRRTRARTTRRRTGTTSRRRTPKLSTTLGSAVALVLVAAFLRLALWWRITLVVVALVAMAIAFLWSRRREIENELHAPPRDVPAAGAGEEEPR